MTTLIEAAYQHFGSITNEVLVDVRQHVRLRVVQELQVRVPFEPTMWGPCVIMLTFLQDSVSKSAVRSAEEDSLLNNPELMVLHRSFHDGCMKARARLDCSVLQSLARA